MPPLTSLLSPLMALLMTRKRRTLADTGIEIDTDPVPTTTAPPTAEHISSFLLYIRRRAADDATATAASAAETLATPPFPGVNVDATEGATAHAASAAAGSYESSDVGVFSPPAADDAMMPTASVAATLADPPSPDAAVGTADGATAARTTSDIPPTDGTADDTADNTTRRCKRRRRHVGPAQAARNHLRIQAYAPQSPHPDHS